MWRNDNKLSLFVNLTNIYSSLTAKPMNSGSVYLNSAAAHAPIYIDNCMGVFTIY